MSVSTEKMFKLAILATVVAFVVGVPLTSPRNKYSTSWQNVTEIIRHHGYITQNYTVQTTDGYILDLIAITFGREGTLQSRPAVVIVPGILSSADDFVMGGPTQGLAFYMVDKGYDVFLANVRGTTYGLKHTKLNPNRDSAFWRFSFHEIGTKDLTAIVDEIIKITGHQKVSIVGHNQGATAALAMISEIPEYNQKIQNVIAMGPLVYMKHSTNSILRLIAENKKSKSWVIKNLGQNQYSPSVALVSESEYDCLSQNIDEIICRNNFFLFNGYNSQNFNMTTIREAVHHVPAGASSRQFLHLAQMFNSGRFEKYTETQDEHVDYDLSKITVPVYVMNVPSDPLCSYENANDLVRNLPNAQMMKFEQLSNNVDFLWSNLWSHDKPNLVYERIYQLLQQ